MAAQQHSPNIRVTVLQLDTAFPRIPGDIGCAQTFTHPPEILRVSGASVANIVTETPEMIDITPFVKRLQTTRGDIVTTSCGFLSYWQITLAQQIHKPFLSSALTALPQLARHYTPDALMIVTFNTAKLNPLHLQGCNAFAQSIIGLPEHAHLRKVIEQDLPQIDPHQTERDLCDLIARQQTKDTRAILFECTNLPPYKAAVAKQCGLPVYDILSCIEQSAPGSIAPGFRGIALP